MVENGPSHDRNPVVTAFLCSKSLDSDLYQRRARVINCVIFLSTQLWEAHNLYMPEMNLLKPEP